jgi:flagellum-specific peptidoglycan hydrolase FlgJ
MLFVYNFLYANDSIQYEVPELNEKNVLMQIKKHEIPHPHIVLAQSKLESGNYKSKLTKTHNNIFGIKRGNKYKKYKNYIECIADYKRLISSRYKGGDYYKFLDKIKYAEKSYTKILKKLVK